MAIKYKRIVIDRRGGPEALQVVEENLPEPAPGEVRVRVLTAGVLLADVLWQSGAVPGGPKPPFTPGYDLVGVVDALGAGVSDLAVVPPEARALLSRFDARSQHYEVRAERQA